MSEDTEHWDAFVSHASEDKETFVRPLVEALGRLGVSLWYDEVSLKVGDSLSGSIDRGIAKSQNGIVVVSPAFLKKNWTEAELRALMSRRIEDRLKLLPVWHNITRAEVADFSPMLADLVPLQTAGQTAQDIAIALLAQVRPDLYDTKGRSELEKLATGKAFEELEDELSNLRKKVSDLLCPSCEAPISERILAYDDMDPNQADIDVFECGHVNGGNSPQACPYDPDFPALSDYEVTCTPVATGDRWMCFVKPKTAAARRHDISFEDGPTEREAMNRVIERYNRWAPQDRQVELL